jgi:hypothetical protein
LERIQYFQQHAAAAAQEASASPYLSVDPTPPFPADTPLEQLRATLLDPQAPMFDVSGTNQLQGPETGGTAAAVFRESKRQVLMQSTPYHGLL